MDFKWLHTFVTAAKYENFRKTAETLFLSQPTVTVHIKQLEKEISCKLFERKGRQIQLTDEGRAYLPYALRLLDDYENSMAELHRVRQGYSQTLQARGFSAYCRYCASFCHETVHSNEYGNRNGGYDFRISGNRVTD